MPWLLKLLASACMILAVDATGRIAAWGVRGPQARTPHGQYMAKTICISIYWLRLVKANQFVPPPCRPATHTRHTHMHTEQQRLFHVLQMRLSEFLLLMFLYQSLSHTSFNLRLFPGKLKAMLVPQNPLTLGTVNWIKAKNHSDTEYLLYE